MANLEIIAATANVTQALLSEAFAVSTRVRNTTSSAIGSAYLIFTIDGTSQTVTRASFSVGAKQTVTVTANFDGAGHPAAWTQAMQSRRASGLYVAASDNGRTTSASRAVESFEILDARYAPRIETFIVERTADEAETVKATIKLSHAALTNAQRERLTCALSVFDGTQYRELTLNRAPEELVAGVQDDTSVITATFAKDADHTLTLIYGDTAEAVRQVDTLEHSFANLHLSGASTGGACFGGFCGATEGSPKLESHYPLYVYGDIMNIQAGTTAAASHANGTNEDVMFDREFADLPQVVCAIDASASGAAFGGCFAAVKNVTTTGFTLRYANTSGETRSFAVRWLAYGVPKT